VGGWGELHLHGNALSLPALAFSTLPPPFTLALFSRASLRKQYHYRSLTGWLTGRPAGWKGGRSALGSMAAGPLSLACLLTTDPPLPPPLPLPLPLRRGHAARDPGGRVRQGERGEAASGLGRPDQTATRARDPLAQLAHGPHCGTPASFRAKSEKGPFQALWSWAAAAPRARAGLAGWMAAGAPRGPCQNLKRSARAFLSRAAGRAGAAGRLDPARAGAIRFDGH
jgi:hypothetical protein